MNSRCRTRTLTALSQMSQKYDEKQCIQTKCMNNFWSHCINVYIKKTKTLLFQLFNPHPHLEGDLNRPLHE